MDWKADIATAAISLVGHVRRTPVLTVTNGFGLDRPVTLKFEHMQHTGSFKVRGAFNTLLSQKVPPAGVVAASGGNHGAAVAYAARMLGHKAHIFVPEMAGPAKIALIKSAGAALTVVSGAYADALVAAQAYQAETGAMAIHAYDAPKTVSGQGTVMHEWLDQGLDADTILIAVGGGGLIAGAMGWLAGMPYRVVAVEPERSCALHAALAAGAPIDVKVGGIAANALGARQIGRICFDLAVANKIKSVTVTDAAIAVAQRALWQGVRQLVEPAGTTALAALMSGAYKAEPDERVAVLICGANIAPDPFVS